MRKIIYYVASTLDFFIAEEDGGIDWLEDPKWEIEGEYYGYMEFIAGIDTTFMGYDTYAWIMDRKITPFPYHDKKNFVFTSHPDPLPCDDVCFVHTNAAAFARTCTDAPGKDIWLVGGGKLAGSFLEAELIDEMILTKVPINLGKGIPLFGSQSFPADATLVRTKSYSNGFIQERWVF